MNKRFLFHKEHISSTTGYLKVWWYLVLYISYLFTDDDAFVPLDKLHL